MNKHTMLTENIRLARGDHDTSNPVSEKSRMWNVAQHLFTAPQIKLELIR